MVRNDIKNSSLLKTKFLIYAFNGRTLFNGYFALFGHVFHGSKRFCLYNCSGCLCFSFRIKQHLVPRFAPFYPAFSSILPCV